MINASHEKIFVEFSRKNNTTLIYLLSVYDYQDIGPSSVVYIFHKGIIL